MAIKTPKRSYTISCSSSFRDAISALAAAREVNVADLARSILLVIPEPVIQGVPDPGGPPPEDREETVLKSGPSAGKPWRRKPRLQVRLSAGYDVTTVRRALNLALRLDQGALTVTLEKITTAPEAPEPSEPPKPPETPELSKPQDLSEPPETPWPSPALREEVDRLQSIVSILLFNPLEAGVATLADARHVMGFAPSDRPDKATVRGRFRMLATIHHPDGHYGSHQRMSQLNAAMDLLSRS
ncbi:MAG: J domain-containing protein [Rhodospirillales bacterium]|nr:J domain-containing protein [Rhodospirillales bacterium]